MSLIPRDGLVDLARQFAVDEIFAQETPEILPRDPAIADCYLAVDA